MNIFMVGPIDVKRTGSASVGYWAQYVTFTFDLTHDLDLTFMYTTTNSTRDKQVHTKGIIALFDVPCLHECHLSIMIIQALWSVSPRTVPNGPISDVFVLTYVTIIKTMLDWPHDLFLLQSLCCWVPWIKHLHKYIAPSLVNLVQMSWSVSASSYIWKHGFSIIYTH